MAMMLKCGLKNMHGRKLLDNPVDADNEDVGYDVGLQAGGHKWIAGWNAKLIIENIRICGYLSYI